MRSRCWVSRLCPDGKDLRNLPGGVGLWLIAMVMAVSACGGDGDGGAPAPASRPFPEAVFIGDTDQDGQVELLAAEARGGQVRLSRSLRVYVPPELIPVFEWSPDRRWVAFRSESPRELYIVPASVGTPVQVSGAAVGTGSSIDGLSYRWAPDSSRLAFVGLTAGGSQELYTALPTGAVSKVSGARPVVNRGNKYEASGFEWAPDSSRLAFVAELGGPDDDEVYTVLPTGGSLMKVSPPSPIFPGGFVRNLGWAPNSSRLAYTKDRTRDGSGDPDELFTVEPLGGNHVKVSGTLRGAPGVLDFAWAPDSSRLLYLSRGAGRK